MKIKFQNDVNGLTALQTALDAVNLRYDGNVLFKRCEYSHNARGGGEVWTVTLTTDHNGPGRGIKPDRNSAKGFRWIASACWHVYGDFMDALPIGTKIRSSPLYLNHGLPSWLEVGVDGLYNDFNVGSLYSPRMASENCHCDSGG